MWKPGNIIAWRGIYRDRVWHAQTTLVVKDTSEELVIALLPGTECVAPEGYLQGKIHGKRRWNFKDRDWKLEKYVWQTNRLLILLEPHKFYSTMYFWDHASDEFRCYYINFQLPFKRNSDGIDTLDLDLDLIIHPDFSFEWKDVDDYQGSIDNEVIFPAWMQGVDAAKQDVLSRLEKRAYPYDGSWLTWIPDQNWLPPKLPENWDKIYTE